MYGKLFEAMYDGTLSSDWKALVTFQQLIILCDQDGVVDVTHEALHGRTGIPLEIISDGISALEQPDARSRTPDCDGRRIIRIDDHRDWGWQIVNHEKYKKLVDLEEKRRQTRERVRKHRVALSNACNADVTQRNEMYAHTDTDTDTDTDINEDEKTNAKKKKTRARFQIPEVSEVADYCLERANGIDPAYFVDHYQTRGWKLKGGTAMKDWKAAIRTWEKNGVQNGSANGKPALTYREAIEQDPELLARELEAERRNNP
jgi:hypothetical protein